MSPHDGRSILLNELIDQCRIHLPGEGTIEVGLKIRHIMNFGAKKSFTELRYGCMFVNIEPDIQTRIQRYILDVEREQRARERG